LSPTIIYSTPPPARQTRCRDEIAMERRCRLRRQFETLKIFASAALPLMDATKTFRKQ
jgi:hypothetical protein